MASIMKGALQILALFHLVILNEGIRVQGWPKKFVGVKIQKTCPRDPKLEAIRKALGLETRVSGRKKRSVSAFPANCIHVAIVELDGEFQFLNPLYECCMSCSYPSHTICNFDGNPEWLCASRAHKCICDCRKTHFDDFMASKTKTSRFKGRPTQARNKLCRKKLCTYGGQCCVNNQCIQLFVHKKKSPVRP